MFDKGCLSCLAVLLSLSIPSRDADKPVVDAGVAEKVIQKFVQLQKPVNPRNWTYREDRVTEQLDSNGRVTVSTRELFEWRVVAGQRESRRTEVDGTKVQEDPVKESAPSGVPEWTFEHVAQRYDFKIAAFEKFQGADVARIRFSPRRNQPPAEGILERVMSNLKGDLWVLVEQKQLIKARATLARPLSFRLFLGRIGKLEISYVRRQVDGDWLPESFHFEVRMRRFFKRTGLRESRRYTNFQELSP